ncbi:MAG: hypothetical protein ACK2T3_05100 [Candidatus Promineifilaceae bacterium]
MTYKSSAHTIIAIFVLLSALLPSAVVQERDRSRIWTADRGVAVEEQGDANLDGAVWEQGHYDEIMVELSRSDIVGDLKEWIVFDKNSQWNDEELTMVQETLFHTFHALESSGMDGQELLKGYRFRRYNGDFVRDERGLVALVKHDVEEIVLPDSAFLRLDGFAIYHEIGHALDQRLEREMNHHFREMTGESINEAHLNGDTAEGYWMRPVSRESSLEATADAFAYWVTKDVVGVRQPIFAGMPLDVDFEAIDEAMEQALTLSRAEN